ncbi:MAG: PilZ domain-containing protein [Betaproteobacteria bacterium]|nr:PilZ domain-containing protein [Betaproteobacteria bacterium]
MSELCCECRAPCSWSPDTGDAAARLTMQREAMLVLNAVNHMEGQRELESGGAENRRLERVEAKLDLALYLLARGLAAGAPATPRPIRLEASKVEWEDASPPAMGAAVVLEVVLSDSLPLPVRLPGEASAARDGVARMRFSGFIPELEDALYQFIFRRHRQAIRSRGN